MFPIECIEFLYKTLHLDNKSLIRCFGACRCLFLLVVSVLNFFFGLALWARPKIPHNS